MAKKTAEQFYLPYEQAKAEAKKLNAKIKKGVKAQKERDKIGKYYRVPGYPKSVIFISNENSIKPGYLEGRFKAFDKREKEKRIKKYV